MNTNFIYKYKSKFKNYIYFFQRKMSKTIKIIGTPTNILTNEQYNTNKLYIECDKENITKIKNNIKEAKIGSVSDKNSIKGIKKDAGSILVKIPNNGSGNNIEVYSKHASEINYSKSEYHPCEIKQLLCVKCEIWITTKKYNFTGSGGIVYKGVSLNLTKIQQY